MNTAEISTQSPYHYVPSKASAIIMLVVFGAGILLHAAQSIRYKMYRLLPAIFLFSIGELLGWGFRLASSYKPLNQAFFQLQMSLLVLAPAPLLAANTVTLEYLVRAVGDKTRFNPKWYTIVFVTFDAASCVTQLVGGDMSAGSSGNKHIEDLGAKVVVGGVAVQMATTLIYLIVVLSYLRFDVSAAKNSVPYGLAISLVFLMIRSISRLVQFSQGWEGALMRNHLYFDFLDATMMILALYSLAILHPGRYIGDMTLARRSSLAAAHSASMPSSAVVDLPPYSASGYNTESDLKNATYKSGEYGSKKALDA